MIDELDVVALVRPLAEHGLATGALGTVVFVYDAGVAFEVEFMTPEGETLAVVTLDPADIRRATAADIGRWRAIEAAK